MNGFKDVIGHKDIIQYIQNAVKQDKLSHAYILNGERGSGKKKEAIKKEQHMKRSQNNIKKIMKMISFLSL